MPVDTDQVSYRIAKRQLGRVSLTCVGPDNSKNDKSEYSNYTFCFDEQRPVLRLEQPYRNIFALFNDIIRAGGHYIDKQILVEDSTHPIVKADHTRFPR
jgi:hypothetical protein